MKGIALLLSYVVFSGGLSLSAQEYQVFQTDILGSGPGSAWSVNNSGVVVGEEIDPVSGKDRAYLYENGNIIDLGGLSGGTIARSISDSGLVVGATFSSTSPRKAFFGKMVSLSSLATMSSTSLMPLTPMEMSQAMDLTKRSSGVMAWHLACRTLILAHKLMESMNMAVPLDLQRQSREEPRKTYRAE